VVAQFALNEKHRPDPREALTGAKQRQCQTCHADKTGPFVIEHDAVRVEGCMACHDAHGSPNRHMLSFQSVGELCYSCHALVPSFHSRFTPETVCTNCHTSIHGSFLDRSFLR
jgi:predicted CXXCH cytochrome family protein